MGYIYLITNKVDQKQYVGQTICKDINERWKSHFKKSSNCRYLKHAFEKFGKENFKFQIICICFDEDCNKYEDFYMKKYNTLVPNGYNLREAGNHGNHNEDTKKKISQSVILRYSKLSEEEKKKLYDNQRGKNNCRFGKPLPKEQKEKMIETIKKNKINGFCKKQPKFRKKVIQYTLENEFVSIYESLSEAVDKLNMLNITKSELSMCCNNKRKSAKGFIWKFGNLEI
jgi:group I intron endonuclease